MSKEFKPFSDESTSIAVDELTIENRIDRVSIYGSIDLTLDKEGYAKAKALLEILQPVLTHLEGAELPDKVAVLQPTTVKNPFA
jgi:hypothetical protein